METTNFKTLTQTTNLLKLTYGIIPIVAGLDKFTNLLTQWESYLPDAVANSLPFGPHLFMMLIGVVEIIAGIIVLKKPAIGGYIVAVWLALIGITLLLSGKYIDVAVRDFVMAIGAFSLAKLATITK